MFIHLLIQHVPFEGLSRAQHHAQWSTVTDEQKWRGALRQVHILRRLSEAHAERLRVKQVTGKEGSVGHHKEDPHWYWGSVGRTAPEEVMF